MHTTARDAEGRFQERLRVYDRMERDQAHLHAQTPPVGSVSGHRCGNALEKYGRKKTVSIKDVRSSDMACTSDHRLDLPSVPWLSRDQDTSNFQVSVSTRLFLWTSTRVTATQHSQSAHHVF